MKSFHTKLLEYKSRNKSRFDLNRVQLDATPIENGILPHVEEQVLEYPNHGKNERIVIYGTNSSGDLIVIRLETRFIKSDSLVRGQIILKRNSTMYTFDELDWNSELINKYRIKGLTIEIISPLRKLRITFRGMMRACVNSESAGADTFVKFNFFWTPFSGAVDGKYYFDPKFLAKDLSDTCSRNLRTNVKLIDMIEDRYEQYGQLIGLINVDNQSPDDEVFFWGSRYKVFLQDHKMTNGKSSDEEPDPNILGPCQSMRLLAVASLHGPAVSMGYVSNDKCSYRYASAFTVPPLAWTVTGTSLTGQDLDQLLHLENNGKVKEYKVKSSGKRNFDMNISNLQRLTDDIVFGAIELKGYPAHCVLIDERNGLLYDQIPSWLNPIPKLMSLELSKAKDGIKTSEYIYSLSDVNAGHELTSGGKGSSLVVLSEISSSLLSPVQFKVPKGVIVSTKSYQYLLDHYPDLKNSIIDLQSKVWTGGKQTRSGKVSGQNETSVNNISGQIRTCSDKKPNFEEQSQNVINKFKSSQLPEFLAENLRRKLHRIFGNFDQISFSIRSSAVGEDGEEMSAAGQMETFLGVQGIEAIVTCIMKCWASQFSPIAVNYRANYCQMIDVPMSVVIQEMVNCDSAGVMFTVDPVTGNEKKIVVTSNYGLGESVVSASAEPDTVTLDVDLKSRSVLGIEDKVIGSKSHQITLGGGREIGDDVKAEDREELDEVTEVESRESEMGTRTEAIDRQKSAVCSVTDEEAINLGRIGLLLHDVWRCPRDIEWGIKDGIIYLFQSRPVTNLDRFSQWELMHELDSGQATETEYVTRANVGEVLPGAMSHLCHTFVISGWGVPGFSRFKYIMGAKDDMFIPYILSFFAVVNNTFFINLKNKHFAFGTEEGAGTEYAILGHRLTDEQYLKEVTEYYSMDPKNSSRLFNLKVMSFVFKESIMAKKKLDKIVNKFKDFVLISPDQKFDSAKELFDHIISNSWQNGYGMLLHGQVTQTSILSSQVLRAMLSKVNDDMASVLVDMSTCLGQCTDVVSAGVPAAIRSIMDNIEDIEKFKNLSDEDALAYICENEKTGRIFNELMQNYGHRGLKEFDLITKVWAMDPMPLIRSLKASSGMSKEQGIKRRDKEESIEETLDRLNSKTSGNLRRILKHVVIPFARASVGWREKSKSFSIWMIHKYRVAFWLLGEMCRNEGRIPDPELLFHLKLDEVSILVRDRNPTLVHKAIQRRKCIKIMDKFKFDEITKGPNIKPRPDFVPSVPSDGAIVMKGTPVCAGKIEARVCVAASLDDAKDIQEGDILITYCTDIGWSPFFPLLSGLATEIGGLVSHGAVIAREFGLPCLVGVDGAPSLFRTGDRAILDSIEGTLTKL